MSCASWGAEGIDPGAGLPPSRSWTAPTGKPRKGRSSVPETCYSRSPLGYLPLPLGEGWGEGAPHDELARGKGCAVFHATGPAQAPPRSDKPPLPLGEGWGEGAPHDELASGKGCAVFHARGLHRPLLARISPLSLWERAGVRACLTTNSPVEKAAPFSTLRGPSSLGQPPLPLGEGWGEGAPHEELASGKGCAVFHATGAAQAPPRSDSPLSLWERAGVRARAS